MKIDLAKSRIWSEQLEARLLLSKATESVIEKFNLSPAVFVENDGQWTDSSVRFVHQGKGASIAMTDRGPIFELYRDVTPVDSIVDDRLEDRFDSRFDDPIERSIESTRFSVSFQNSNITTPIGHDRSSSTFNYNVGTPDLHRSNVPGFEKIVYPNLYKGIDLHTWGQRDSLKYEFHVAPNIDYHQIAVQYEGVEDLWIDDRGRLHANLSAGFGEVIDDSPVIWQEVKGKRVDVAGKFKLLDGDAYTFELTGKFDPKLPLVIDPDLAWGSYLGGIQFDNGRSIFTDSSGNIYISGESSSSGWINGGFDTSLSGFRDAFVVKMNASGVHIWSTYVGGGVGEWSPDLAVDSQNNVVMTGITSSSGWVNGGFDVSYGGNKDAFAIKLNAAGEHLWSTYLGGSGVDYGYGVTVDLTGDIYISGETFSSDWITGVLDTNLDGASDAFVVKLNSGGEHLWSTYLGGEVGDEGYSITTDTAGGIYVAGSTGSSGWISGGYDTTMNDHEKDGFVLKLSVSGNHLWSTYLGGIGHDYGFDLVADDSENLYVTGRTESVGWVSGGFDTSINGSQDAFVLKLSSVGEHLWSTYLGGSSSDFGYGIDCNGNNVFITGRTTSPGWISGGFDETLSGASDAFAVKLSATGEQLWSTYLGGTSADFSTGIAVSVDGNVYVTGETDSSGWISGGLDTSYGGSIDGFVAKITDHADVSIPVFENSIFNYLTTSEQTLTATFNENISASLAASDFILTNLNTTTNIPLTLQSISPDGQSATFTFSATGNDLGDAILTDGHYRIRALAGQIEDAAGNALSQDVDHFFEFKNCDFALEDHVVDFNDLLIIAQNYNTGPGKFFEQGDANYDGFVDFNDLLAVAQRYNTGIPELRINRLIPTPTKSNRIIGDMFGSEAVIQ